MSDEAECVRALRALDRAMFGIVRVVSLVGHGPTDAAMAGVTGDGHGVEAGDRTGASLTGKKEDSAMRITSKGQVTIPQAVREQAGLLPETEVEFIVEDDAVRLVKARRGRRPSRGARAVERLRGAGRVSLSTEEIMALTRGES